MSNTGHPQYHHPPHPHSHSHGHGRPAAIGANGQVSAAVPMPTNPNVNVGAGLLPMNVTTTSSAPPTLTTAATKVTAVARKKASAPPAPTMAELQKATDMVTKAQNVVVAHAKKLAPIRQRRDAAKKSYLDCREDSVKSLCKREWESAQLDFELAQEVHRGVVTHFVQFCEQLGMYLH